MGHRKDQGHSRKQTKKNQAANGRKDVRSVRHGLYSVVEQSLAVHPVCQVRELEAIRAGENEAARQQLELVEREHEARITALTRQ